VYLPLPTSLHLEWVVKCAQAKKHILCEKPVALSREDLEVMLKACKDNGVHFMDGVMFMHHDRSGPRLGLPVAPLFPALGRFHPQPSAFPG
jgi:hypothetical protein